MEVFIAPSKVKLKKVHAQANSFKAIGKQEIFDLGKQKSRLSEEKESIIKKIGNMEERLRQEKNISILLDKFILTAKKRKLEFTHVKPLPTKNIMLKEINMSLLEIPVALELEASFNEFLEFLWETERLDLFLKIKQLSIVTDSGNTLRHKEKITISVHQLNTIQQ